jgi:hypothetical protein
LQHTTVKRADNGGVSAQKVANNGQQVLGKCSM